MAIHRTNFGWMLNNIEDLILFANKAGLTTAEFELTRALSKIEEEMGNVPRSNLVIFPKPKRPTPWDKIG